MHMKQELISIIVNVLLVVGVYLLYSQGATTLSEIGTAIVAALIGAILIVFWWGFRGHIERWTGKSRKTDVPTQNTTKSEREELELLIQPLFFAFDKYPDDPKTMEREKFGLSMLWSLMSHPAEKSQKYLHLEKADPVIEAMQQYGNLAQPELRDLIRDFFEFKQAQKDGKTRIHDPYFEETTTKVEKIRELAASRYKELMWGKKE